MNSTLKEMMTQSNAGPDQTPVSMPQLPQIQPLPQGQGGGTPDIMSMLLKMFTMGGGEGGGTAASPMGGGFAGGASAYPGALGGMGMFGG